MNRATRRGMMRAWNRTAGTNRHEAPPQRQGDPSELDSITLPDSPAALEEALADGRFVARIAGAGLLPEAMKRYATNVMGEQSEIRAQVREQVEQVTLNWLRENESPEASRLDLSRAISASALDAPETRAARRGGLFNPRAMGAQLDSEFEGAADYFKHVYNAHTGRLDPAGQALHQRVRNAFSSTVPSDGGFLIPENLRSELLRVSLESAVVRPRARVIPMETLRVPFPTIDSTSNVSSVFGGIVAYWTEEGAALVESSAKFGRTVLDAKKLTAYTEVPSELVADSIGSFETFIQEMFPEALAWYEDNAFLAGTGVGEPLGLLTAGNTARISQAAESGQEVDTIVWENVIKMYARMLPQSLNRAVWLVSPDTFPQLATMALSVGTGGSAVWLNNGSSGPPMTILGRPVIVTEKASLLGDLGDINFVDFGYYLIGDRQVASAQVSTDYKFGLDKIAYRIISRVDGRPWLQTAITPKNNGNTLSPFVSLAAR